MAVTKSSQKNQRFQITAISTLLLQLFSLGLIFFGSVLVFIGAAGYFNLDLKHPFIEEAAIAEPVSDNYPVKLFIPKLSKTLNISPGEAVKNRWTISDTGVSYLADSAPPGTAGNSVIYGHNRNNILGKLPYINHGDKIYVLLNSGEIVIYEVAEEKEISPYQVEILSQTADSRLTIFTCSGFLDSSRFVVIAKQLNTI